MEDDETADIEDRCRSDWSRGWSISFVEVLGVEVEEEETPSCGREVRSRRNPSGRWVGVGTGSLQAWPWRDTLFRGCNWLQGDTWQHSETEGPAVSGWLSFCAFMGQASSGHLMLLSSLVV